MKLNANNEQETRAIAAKLAEYLTAGDVILLEGNLGAGKTTFTKGLAEGLGIKRVVKSP
ncbi:MAG: tRNA (adenosine(37)-N6)-threonylcarbamoyltransferase complex ATPase subunit type 1 TsaE, partial [Carnobacterium sp.]